VHANVQANGRRLDKELQALLKILRKAEKSEKVSYFKAGLSLALDIAIIVSPQVRALSVISKFAIGGMIDIGSNAVFGKPEDFIGTTIGMTTSGTEIDYRARGLTKGADALAKAGKALKISGVIGSASDIKKAHKTVNEIKSSIAKIHKGLIANAKYLKVVAKTVEVAKRDIRNLLKRLQADVAQADNAEST